MERAIINVKNLLKIIDKLKLFLFGYHYVQVQLKHNTNKHLSVIYALNDSLPEINNGYTVRSHHIASACQIEDINIYPVTRLCFPFDTTPQPVYEKKSIDKIEYTRLYEKGFMQHTTATSLFIEHYTLELLKFANKKKVNVLHGASNYVNGLAAINAARILNLPSIYEVRGFWEITEASRNPSFKNSFSYKIQKQLETQACHDATSVIALSEIVKEELIHRGVEEKKIYIVPNDVDTDKFSKRSKDQKILSELGWDGKFVVGFIGTVSDYEGLHFLIKAAEKIKQSDNDMIRYLIVGDGNDLENLKQDVKEKDLSDIFVFTGRVPFEDVEQYYSIIDTACYPRLNWEVCTIVSPKKPFEAMAYGIPIIASSVHANSYFIEDGISGLIHPYENAEALAKKIALLYKDDILREKIAKNARKWVIQHRDSKLTGPLMKKIYLETLEKYNSRNQL